MMRAMTASTVDAVSNRIQQVSSDSAPIKAFSLGRSSNLTNALLANGRSIGNGTFDLGQLLAGSSFSLPLNDAGSSTFGSLSLWGSGDYRHFSGGDFLEYDGDVTSAHIGMDNQLNAEWLTGMAVSWSQSSVDYTIACAVRQHQKHLTSINPTSAGSSRRRSICGRRCWLWMG